MQYYFKIIIKLNEWVINTHKHFRKSFCNKSKGLGFEIPTRSRKLVRAKLKCPNEPHLLLFLTEHSVWICKTENNSKSTSAHLEEPSFSLTAWNVARLEPQRKVWWLRWQLTADGDVSCLPSILFNNNGSQYQKYITWMHNMYKYV